MPHYFGFLSTLLSSFIWYGSSAQLPLKGYEHLFTPPLNYVVQQTTAPIIIDGDLNDAAWQQAKWTSNFVDIEGSLNPLPRYATKVKMLWDDSCLYIAAQITEPQVWGTLKNAMRSFLTTTTLKCSSTPTEQHIITMKLNLMP